MSTSTRSSAPTAIGTPTSPRMDADALLALHLAEPPAPLDIQDAAGAPLPARHPITQLVREAAWLVSHPAFAA